MIIFFMGLPGAGKSTLSKAVAERLTVYRFEIDKLKRELYPIIEPDFQYKLDNNIPLSDAVHLQLYTKAVEGLVALAGTQEHVIVDEVLHKEHYRQMLFAVAERYFGGYMTIWIKTPDPVVRERLTSAKREGHLLKDPVGTYEIFRQKFEDPTDVDVTITNEGEPEQTITELVSLIKTRLGTN